MYRRVIPFLLTAGLRRSKQSYILRINRNGASFHCVSDKLNRTAIKVNNRAVQFRPLMLNFLDSIISDVNKRLSTEHERFKLKIIQQIVSDEISAVTSTESSKLLTLVHSLPKSASYVYKVNRIKTALSSYPLEAVITAHPTMLFSNPVLFQLYDLTEKFLGISTDTNQMNEPTLKEDMSETVMSFVKNSMLPNRSLSPEEEAERCLFIYTKILETFPHYIDSIVNYFTKVHGGGKFEFEREILQSVIDCSKKTYSWVHGDADGNYEVNAETMARAIPKQQTAIISNYEQRLRAILIELQNNNGVTPEVELLENKIAYLNRCIKAIKSGIWFDVSESEKIQSDFYYLLTGIINYPNLSDALMQKIKHARDLINLAGFAGGLREFVRQTTFQYTEAITTVVDLLSQNNFSDLNKVLYDDNKQIRKYAQLTYAEKTQILKLLGKQPKFFVTIKNNLHLVKGVSEKELKRLFLVLEIPTIFPYHIFSDTESVVNFDEARIIARLGQYLYGRLKIGDTRRHPTLMLPLCETPQSIRTLGKIINSILEDRPMREKIIDEGYLSYVSGPSDISKKGGILTHLDLLIGQIQVEDLLNEKTTKYPELRGVKLRILHGYGGDYKRRIGAERQLHATHQGAAAYYALGAPNMYYKLLHRCVGFPSESDRKVAQLRNLMKSDPEAYRVLLKLKESSVRFFQNYMQKSYMRQVLNDTTYFDIEAAANTSSRAGSKELNKVGHFDATKARAIGVLNHFLLCGDHFDIILSIYGAAEELSSAEKHFLPRLYQNQTIVKEIVLKIFYAMGTNQRERSWHRILEDRMPTRDDVFQWGGEFQAGTGTDTKHLIAFHELASLSVLKFLLEFVQADKVHSARDYLKKHESQLFTEKLSLSQLTRSLLKLLGDQFTELANEIDQRMPRYELLSESLKSHREACSQNKKFTLENATLALRGARFGLFAGPKCIADLVSQEDDQYSSEENKQYESL